ncbi:MAG: hypothetical protein MUF10_00220 [Thermoanaerobaculaceae bacterium]|nr:hypothetical protein [Thermoanaerobaculaceae bacterium]
MSISVAVVPIPIALEDLKLERLRVVYPGSRTHDLHERVNATPLSAVPGRLSTP